MNKARRALREKAKAARLESRKLQLVTAVPSVLRAPSLLYIGANVRRMEMLDLFIGKGCDIDILEAWPANAEGLVRWNKKTRAVNAVLLGDVLDLAATRLYDTVMWWHGPEHVSHDRLDDALGRVERAATRLVVLASPWGNVEQDEAYGNPYERHQFGPSDTDFIRRGYLVSTSGAPGVLGSNMIAWKKVAP